MTWLLSKTPAFSLVSTDFRSSSTSYIPLHALPQDPRGLIANLHLFPQLSIARMTQLPLVHFSPNLAMFDDSFGL